MKKTLLTFLLTLTMITVKGQSISATITPNPVVAGNDVTIDITFTSTNSTDIIQLNLERLDSGYGYVSTVDYQEYVVPSIGTNQTVQYTVTIPADTTPSSDIGTDFYFYKIELSDSSYNWLAGYYEDPLTVNSTLSVQDFNSKTISVYPNPVNETLYFNTNNDINGGTYEIYDLMGKVVVSKSKILNNNIDTSDLKSGIYLLKIEDFNPIRIVKQ